ncbi:MAG: hypothetical protein ACUVUR_01615 [bacterium]
MVNILIMSVVILNGFDIGGRVGIAFPTGGFSRSSRSSTVIGAQAGYSLGRHRAELGYSFFSFPGQQSSPYEVMIQELALGYCYEFFTRPVWGINLSTGPGFGFIRRTLGIAKESGGAPNWHLGVMFVQHEGKSRVSAGIDNIIYFEGVRRLALSYFPVVRAEVAYAF